VNKNEIEDSDADGREKSEMSNKNSDKQEHVEFEQSDEYSTFASQPITSY
jgi:hypothetical protein